MVIVIVVKQIIVDGMNVCVVGGQENISVVQNKYFEWVKVEEDVNVIVYVEYVYMLMLFMVENVVKKYGVFCEVQDEYVFSL